MSKDSLTHRPSLEIEKQAKGLTDAKRLFEQLLLSPRALDRFGYTTRQRSLAYPVLSLLRQHGVIYQQNEQVALCLSQASSGREIRIYSLGAGGYYLCASSAEFDQGVVDNIFQDSSGENGLFKNDHRMHVAKIAILPAPIDLQDTNKLVEKLFEGQARHAVETSPNQNFVLNKIFTIIRGKSRVLRAKWQDPGTYSTLAISSILSQTSQIWKRLETMQIEGSTTVLVPFGQMPDQSQLLANRTFYTDERSLVLAGLVLSW